jgi:hypothetical protein
MDVAIADPTGTALARHDLVVDPPVGDQVRDGQAREGHGAITPVVMTALRVAITPVVMTELPDGTLQVTAIAGRSVRATGIVVRHTRTIVQTAETAQLDQTAATDQGAPIAQLVSSATTVPVARNAEDDPIAVPVAATGPPRNVCGPKAVHPHAETTTPANASQKKIATLSASAQSVPFIRHQRFPRASLRRCLTVLHSMSSKL